MYRQRCIIAGTVVACSICVLIPFLPPICSPAPLLTLKRQDGPRRLGPCAYPRTHRFWAKQIRRLGQSPRSFVVQEPPRQRHRQIRTASGLFNRRRPSLLELVHLLIHRCKLCRHVDRQLQSEGMSHKNLISGPVHGDNIRMPVRTIQPAPRPVESGTLEVVVASCLHFRSGESFCACRGIACLGAWIADSHIPSLHRWPNSLAACVVPLWVPSLAPPGPPTSPLRPPSPASPHSTTSAAILIKRCHRCTPSARTVCIHDLIPACLISAPQREKTPGIAVFPRGLFVGAAHDGVHPPKLGQGGHLLWQDAGVILAPVGQGSSNSASRQSFVAGGSKSQVGKGSHIAAHAPPTLAAARRSGRVFTRIIIPSRAVEPVGAVRGKYSGTMFGSVASLCVAPPCSGPP